MHREDVRGFLMRYEVSLQQDLRCVAALAKTIHKRAVASTSAGTTPHLNQAESVFLNEYAIPRLFLELQTQQGLSKDEARTALLSENHGHMTSMCFGSPSRPVRHPFDKTFAPNARDVFDRWRRGGRKAFLHPCPDFALRAPCPFSIVFEGKFFTQGGVSWTEEYLVKSIYQAFFYRALPKVDATASRAQWDYEFACLLLCDASPDGTLLQAWNSVPPDVQDGFWECANLYVMVVRGET